MQILNPTATTTAYTGVLRSTYQIAAGEGFFSLWRGMSSVIVGAGPAHAVYFATYEAVKHAMGGNQAGVHHPLAAGTRCLKPPHPTPTLFSWAMNCRLTVVL
jgi:solute carrier family 25 iron transporter 28/37